MQCVYCGSPLPQGARFCTNCGKVPQEKDAGQTEATKWSGHSGGAPVGGPQPAGQAAHPTLDSDGVPSYSPPPVGAGSSSPNQGLHQDSLISHTATTEQGALPQFPISPPLPQGPGTGGPNRGTGGTNRKSIIGMVLIILAVVVVLGSGSFIAYATVFHGGQNNNPNTTNNGTKNAGKTATPTAGQTTPTPQPGTVPSNTATFQLKVTLTLKADNGQAFKGAVWGRSESEEITLVVAGGKVCQVRDDGRAVSESFDLPTGQLGDKWTYARKFACSGTYADGKLSYTETVTSETLTGQGSLSSTSTADLASKACPYKEYVFDQLDGTFSNATTISGNFSWSGSVVGHCDGQAPVKGSGTWTSKLA